MPLRREKSIGVLLLGAMTLSFASSHSVQHAQSRLKHLDSKIHALKHHLEVVHGQQGALEQTLSQTEKKIGEIVHHLNQTHRTLQYKQDRVHALTVQSQTLSYQLTLQQQALAKHVQMRYMMGEYQPFKSLLNAQTPAEVSHIVVFYRYVIQSRKELILAITKTQHRLAQNRGALEKGVKIQQALQHRLKEEQTALAYHQSKNMIVLRALTQKLKTEAEQLKDYEHNKANLAALLERLMIQSKKEETAPYLTERTISTFLAQPVRGSQIKAWHQGLLFVAKEGTPVNAVQGGKVVFSDWLRGYGLLLILDHGRGIMTLYGYNQALFKRNGDRVKAGERIATVGHTGGRYQDGVYFEVRRSGKVIAAQNWLNTVKKA